MYIILKKSNFLASSKLKGLELKNKGHTNFYERSDLRKKVYLIVGSISNYASRAMALVSKECLL